MTIGSNSFHYGRRCHTDILQRPTRRSLSESYDSLTGAAPHMVKLLLLHVRVFVSLVVPPRCARGTAHCPYLAPRKNGPNLKA
jgi:hypothetical protein